MAKNWYSGIKWRNKNVTGEHELNEGIQCYRR